MDKDTRIARLDTRIAELEHKLKRRDERIEEQKVELDAAYKLIGEQDEYVDDSKATLTRWKETFDMVEVKPGKWGWGDFVEGHNKLVDDHNKLVRDWNWAVPILNAKKRNIGRPLAASEGQRLKVLKLRDEGHSLRDIENATSLGLRTIRTIIDKKDGADRATIKHLERIAPDRAAAIRERVRRRDRNALPGRVAALEERGDELLKAAKGLLQGS